MKIKNYMMLACAAMTLGCLSCANSKKAQADETAATEASVQVPAFNADSAYLYVKQQVDFGPRTPGSEAHDRCGDYLAAKLEAFGAKVYNQRADLTGYDGRTLKARNIIGAYNPDSKRRVLLCAHWDTRPWADNDPDKANHRKPILGANDGASGVGVLLEVARQLQRQAPAIGIDIIFFDMEDYGTPQFAETLTDDSDTWCLGSQYWSRAPHVKDYNARFGILLDMVGGHGATFLKEGVSLQYAEPVVKKVWRAAKKLGLENYFVDEHGGYVNDDHVPVNEIARIPCIVIVNCDLNGELSSFGDFWHTLDDNMDVIDRNTLQAVGQTVLQVIYNEK